MRFIHVADTHLGKRNYKLKEREEDFYKAFEKVISTAIEERVDFIVHSGDLFDTGKPSLNTLIFSIEQLKKLKEKDIPFFVIPGSHDVSVEGTPLSLLEKIGLVINLGSPRYYEKLGDKIILKGEKYGDVFLAGIPGKRAHIMEIYQRLIPKFKESKFKIFLFHHTISDVSSLFADIPKSLLPRGFDYYAGGHWHITSEYYFLNKPIVYPGSTERVDANEFKNKKKCGFYLIDYDGEIKKEFIETEQRKVEIHKINCDNLSPPEIVDKCISVLKEGNGAIAFLELFGKLRIGNRGEINKERINEIGRERGYLYVKVELSDLMNPISKIKEISKKTIFEIEDEFLRKKGYKDEDIELARIILDYLGKDLKGNELELAQKRIVEYIRDKL